MLKLGKIYHPTSYLVIISCATILFNQNAYPKDLDSQFFAPRHTHQQKILRDRADQLMMIGSRESQKGNGIKAIPFWLQALDIYQKLQDYEAMGRVYEFLGITYGQLGQELKAEDALRKRLNVARDRKDLAGQIFGLNNIGTLLLRRGYPQAAKQSFSEALTIARSLNSPRAIGLSLNNLGLAVAGEGQYKQAIKYYQEALVWRRLAIDPLGIASTSNNQGDSYLASGLITEAITSYHNGLKTSENALDLPGQYRGIDGLIVAYSLLKDYPKALNILDKRLAISVNQRLLNQELRSIRIGAEIYEKSGDDIIAEQYYQRGVQLAKILQDKPTELQLRQEIARIRMNRLNQRKK